MQIAYSFPGKIGEWGLGTIAQHQVDTLKNHSQLAMVYSAMSRNGNRHDDWEHDMTVALERFRKNTFGNPIHAWGNAAMSTFSMTEQGVVLILERASTHPLHQAAVLYREARVMGTGTDPTNPYDVLRGSLECEFADIIVVPSEQAAETFLPTVRDRVRVVPFGTDLTRFHPRSPEEEASRPPTPVFGFMGLNWLRKGIVRLTNAWNEGRFWEHGCVLRIAGCPEQFPHSIMQQLGMIGDPMKYGITLDGPQEEPETWMRSIDCLILPSVEEGHAKVLIEAGATGLPVICTQACGHPIETDKHGLLLPTPIGEGANAKDILASIELLLDPNECKRLGRNHLQLVQSTMTWHHYQERLWKTAYQPILEET